MFRKFSSGQKSEFLCSLDRDARPFAVYVENFRTQISSGFTIGTMPIQACGRA